MAKDKKVEAGIDGLRKDNGITSITPVEDNLLWGGKDFIQPTIDRVRHIRMVIEAMVDKIGFADIDGEIGWRSFECRSKRSGQFADWAMARGKRVINLRLRNPRCQRGLVSKPPFRDGRNSRHRKEKRNKKDSTPQKSKHTSILTNFPVSH